MNSLVNDNQQKMKFSAYVTQKGMVDSINKMVGSDRGQSFITSIISAVSTNPALSECLPSTIISAALIGESLKLSPSPFMGHYYMVPFKDRKNNRIVAQFQIGYKGYMQLAMRSGQYKDIGVIEVKEGEYIGRDTETGKPKFKFIENDEERDSKVVIGYLAYFELLNGFKKTLYWSSTKMKEHAFEYSQGYKSDVQKNTAYTFWSKNFQDMAFKTLLRQLISKWGIMSVELETAFAKDQAVIGENNAVEFIDNPNETTNYEEVETVKHTQSTEDIVKAYETYSSENKEENKQEVGQQSLFDALD